MILGIDHVGLLTDDLPKAGTYLAAMGLDKVEAGVAEQYGVACEFWQLSPDPAAFAIELVAPVREDAVVSSRLKRNGPGLYHIALEVDDIVGELERLRQSGFVQVDQEPCAGAREGMQVAFMFLGKPVGMMVELVKYDAPRRSAQDTSSVS
ncbi:bleomycin resistance protein [Solihabitans fulvus]|uniref:Bleomycin resistance protein n=1 Tax=Solihabitans fulvus TaxID=1892852 RepID=A0A5B2X1L5_9PSEU|nr:VOC family protein [Solihabitans fulvus]KAA2257092.1 bleomycin resistance protein [Solihabitans fulvus]